MEKAESSAYGLEEMFQSTPDLAQHLDRISIRGLDSDLKSSLDLFKPVLYSYSKTSKPPSEGNGLDYIRFGTPIEHLTACTIWKGLSVMHADILFEMHRVFVPCLEQILAAQLDQMDGEARKENTPFQSHEVKSLHFNLSELIERMLNIMQLHCCLEADQCLADFLMEMMLLFFISRNCLVGIETHKYADTSIHVHLLPGKNISSNVELLSAVHVTQQSDYLSFVELEISPREGRQLRIVPHYMHRHGKRAKAKPKHTDISYTLATPVPWLAWDDEISGFRGTVPMFSECGGSSGHSGKNINVGREGPYTTVNLLRIEVEATLVEYHSLSNLRLKRTIRVRLNLKVIPWYSHHSAPAPRSELYTQPGYCMLNDEVCGNNPDDETIILETASQADSFSSQNSSLLTGEHLKSTLPATSTQKVSQPFHHQEMWRSFDSKNYDIGSIFAGHRPYHKANTLPGSPRKHVDEHFGLEVSNIIKQDSMRQNLQVYTLRNTDFNVPGFTNPPQSLPSYRYSPLPFSIEPAESFELPTIVTIQHPEPESRIAHHPSRLHYEELMSLDTSDQVQQNSTVQMLAPSSPLISFAQENTRLVSATTSIDELEILENEFWSRSESAEMLSAGATSLSLHRQSGRAQNDERRENSYFRNYSGAQSDIESLHWQDPLHFDDGFFDSHEHHERRRSIRRAGFELFDIAQTLQTPQADVLIPASEEDGSAIQEHPSAPTRTVADEASSRITSPSLELKDENNSGQSLARSWSASEADKNDKLPPKSKGKQRAETPSDAPSPVSEPHVMFYHNQYSPLRDAKEDSGISKDTQGLFVQHRTSSDLTIWEPEQGIANSYKAVSMKMDASYDGTVEDVGSLKSPREQPDNTNKRRLVSYDSGYGLHNVSDPNRVPGSINRSESNDALLCPKSRLLRDTCLVPGESSPSTSRETSGSVYIKVEDDDIDPRLRREQAILWQLLKNESLAKDGWSGSKGKEDDIKLEKEVKLALWESLKKEARTKEGSEVTLGMESNVNVDEESGDDMEFEEEREEGKEECGIVSSE